MRCYRSLLSGFAGCLTVIFIVCNTRTVNRLEDFPEKGFITVQDYTVMNNLSYSDNQPRIGNQAYRYVTPSLSELGGRGNMPETNDHVLMLMRVPGSGAELLVLILQHLQGYNAFKHMRLPRGDDGILTTLQQELLVEEITSIIRQEAVPLSLDGDMRFLNFSTFGRQAPTFISIVRDPMDPRIMQWHREGDETQSYQGSISYFCGQDPRCTRRNSKWALERAKVNVLRWYPIIGILDHMEATLDALQDAFPFFFNGASQLYEKLRPMKGDNFDRTITSLAKKHSRKMLAKEIEFYEWLKSRLLDKTSGNG